MPLTRIMLVDDDNVVNLINRVLLNDFLPSADILTYNSSVDAIAFLKANSTKPEVLPQLILLDLNMPEMDGWEFCVAFEKIFQDDSEIIPDIKFLSTSSHPEDMVKSLRFKSVSEYLIKPLSVEEVERRFK
ncbi:response regulator [Luteibaculum oceani]|uniref:Response regulator n=1 Tax=Luteibaculum oceani TaxID=1294296 RepID=A0A5C6UVC9_9FLAO|nr:response regulator [Luteibaculum oceani]TXC76201.1 response regulator [Luteibaculum oceani]